MLILTFNLGVTFSFSIYSSIITAYEKERTHFLGTVVQVQQDEEGGLKHFVIVELFAAYRTEPEAPPP